MYRDTPHPVHLKDYQPPEFLIDRVDLRFELDPERTRVESVLALRRNPAATRGDGDLCLHGEQLDLEHGSRSMAMPLNRSPNIRWTRNH